MSSGEKSPKKFPFLFVSILVHAALIYFIAYKALDYALPEGNVTSYEMNFQGSQGHTEDKTNVDVVEKKAAPTPPAPAVKAPTPKAPVAKAPAKAAPKVVTGDMPVKEPIAEPTHDDSKEALTQAQDDSLQKQDDDQKVPDVEPLPVAAEEVAPPEPTPAAPAQATDSPKPGGTDTTNAAPSAAGGSPDGVQSDTVLTPFGTNRPITYPMMARMRKLEGTAIVHYGVDASGSVTTVEIIQSSGSPSLDDQVISTIKGWKFKPMGHDGVYERPVQFSLKGDAQAAPSRLRRSN